MIGPPEHADQDCEASAKIDAARLIMRATCIEAMADARRGYVPDIAAKTKSRRDGPLRQSLHRSSIAIVRGERSARVVTTGRCNGSFVTATRLTPHRIQLRCGRHQLRTGCAGSALRKPDALRRRMTDAQSIRSIRIGQRAGERSFADRSRDFRNALAPMPPASPSSRPSEPTESPMA